MSEYPNYLEFELTIYIDDEVYPLSLTPTQFEVLCVVLGLDLDRKTGIAKMLKDDVLKERYLNNRTVGV